MCLLVVSVGRIHHPPHRSPEVDSAEYKLFTPSVVVLRERSDGTVAVQPTET